MACGRGESIFTCDDDGVDARSILKRLSVQLPVRAHDSVRYSVSETLRNLQEPQHAPQPLALFPTTAKHGGDCGTLQAFLRPFRGVGGSSESVAFDDLRRHLKFGPDKWDSVNAASRPFTVAMVVAGRRMRCC